MSTPLAPFKQRLKHALESDTLELALDRALTAFRERRAAAFEPGEFQQLRADLKRRKNAALENLPALVEQFTKAAEGVGAVVHLAADAEEARAIIGRLARERGVKLVTKSKSMATEEIGLNPYLEGEGIEVVETDLGEWIIQVGNDHPSHLIAPAIHWTREEVADLFTGVTGEQQEPDIDKLVKVARRRLRQKFIDSDMGITGANIGIADTGTLVIVTNEGNADLVSTLPPIHVAILGVEKIVPALDDAIAVLKLLPRSATGQRLSTYTQFITGPSRTADIELSMSIGVHGPEEVHIVLVDNGRWDLIADPEFYETMRCIRCAACSNVCPSYQAVGGHAFGHIYTGPIGLILTAQHHGMEAAAGPQSLCASCNACEQVCPVEIPLPKLILGVRQRYVAEKGLPFAKRTGLNLFANRGAFEAAVGLGRLLQRPFKHRHPAANGTDGAAPAGYVRPPFAPGFRSLPALPPKGLHDRMKRWERRLPDDRLTDQSPLNGKQVAMFAGCITNLAYPEMGESVARLAERAGATVSFPQDQWCCGLVFLNAGDREGAIPLAKQTIECLERALNDGADELISGSASCVVSIQQDYPDLFKDDPQWLARAQAVAARLTDFTHLARQVFAPQVAASPAAQAAGQQDADRTELNAAGGPLPEPGSAPLDASDSPLPPAEGQGVTVSDSPLPLGEGPGVRVSTVTYHDSCQSFNCLNLHDEGREVLAALGMQVTEMADSSVCCGFGGSFSMDHPAVSERIVRRKLRNVAATGADTVVADNPGCIMHLRGAIDALRTAHPDESAPRVLHLAELIEERLKQGSI